MIRIKVKLGHWVYWNTVFVLDMTKLRPAQREVGLCAQGGSRCEPWGSFGRDPTKGRVCEPPAQLPCETRSVSEERKGWANRWGLDSVGLLSAGVGHLISKRTTSLSPGSMKHGWGRKERRGGKKRQEERRNERGKEKKQNNGKVTWRQTLPRAGYQSPMVRVTWKYRFYMLDV